MIAEPQTTRYDLNFRIGPFPARVHPLFWLVAIIMGHRTLESDNPFAFLGIWIGVVFVSILVHELGHAVAYRAFGSSARVWLYWFGGLAVSNNPPGSPWKLIVVLLAGPGAGFLLAGLLFASERLFRWEDQSPYTHHLYYQAMWVNLAWGVVNLLPVMPLDGGQTCREVCRVIGVRRPVVLALKISVAVAGAVAIYGVMDVLDQPRDLMDRVPATLRTGSFFLPLLFGMLAFSSYQMLQQVNRPDAYWDDADDETPPWRRRY